MYKIFLVSLYLSFAVNILAQTGNNDSINNLKNQYIVRFDVKNGNVYMPHVRKIKDTSKVRFTNPKVGQFIRIIFENVPKDYKVSADALFVDKNLENAGTFQTFLSKNEEKINEDKVKNQKEAEKSTDSTTKEIKKNNREQDSIVIELNKQVQSLASTADLIVNQLNNMKEIDSRSHLIQEVTTNANNIQKTAEKIKEKNSEISDDIEKILQEAKKIIKDEEITVKNVTDYKNEVANGLVYDKEALKIKINELKKMKLEYEKIISNSVKLMQYKDSLIQVYKEIAFIKDTIRIQPIQVENRDFTQLAIKYTNDKNETTAREITLKNRKGFKIDFSTGFIGTGLVDENYRVEPDTANFGKIKCDPKGKFAIGFALLSHAYFRTGNRVNVSLNAGLMLNGGNQTVNYITGLSLPLGLEQRFIISAGAALGKVKTLTNGYEEGKSYRGILTTGVPYTDKWRGSWFIGITYNIAGLAGNSQAKVVQGKKE